MALMLYNTLTRKIDKFESLVKGKVGLYSCGPTVYDYQHIGNFRTVILGDVLKRTLMYLGYEVKHVINFTDVGHMTGDTDEGEDKLEKGAEREGKTVWEIAQFYIDDFKQDIHKLNVIEPAVWCRATEYMQEQIELMKQLEKKGYTYETDEAVYYDTSKFKDYATFAKLQLEQLKAGARIGHIEGKKNPSDFVLWVKRIGKHANHIMHWPSPWGEGFPGWHTECCAMSIKHLGETIDIHTGGTDLIPVHHTNEIAQAEAATGKLFVRYWVHGAFLLIGKDKMAKSEGTFVRMQDLVDKGFDAMDYRFYVLNAHYRQQLSFTWDSLENAKHSFNKLKERVLTIKANSADNNNKLTDKGESYKQTFLETISDDLGMPKAISVLHEVIRDQALSDDEKWTLIQDFDQVFGLQFNELKPVSVSTDIQELLDKREQARKEKNFELSDELRDQVESKGYIINDTPEGPKLSKK